MLSRVLLGRSVDESYINCELLNYELTLDTNHQPTDMVTHKEMIIFALANIIIRHL